MRKRLIFLCWNPDCDYKKKEFSYMLEFKGEPLMQVTCPFCGSTGVFNRDQFSDKPAEVLRSMEKSEENTENPYNFPEKIALEKLEEK